MKIRRLDILLSISYFLILTYGCSDDYDDKYKPKDTGKVNISGKVVDQVTKQPIEGATIYYGTISAKTGSNKQLSNTSVLATSGQDGSFSCLISSSSVGIALINSSSSYAYMYADKTGYVGSNLTSLSGPPGYSISGYLQLYHPAKLLVNIWNDTISNNNDGAMFGIIESSGQFSAYPGFIGLLNGSTPITFVSCSGRKFNKDFEFYPLWGNLVYTLYFNPFFSDDAKAVTVKPDSTTYYSISF